MKEDKREMQVQVSETREKYSSCKLKLSKFNANKFEAQINSLSQNESSPQFEIDKLKIDLRDQDFQLKSNNSII